VHERLDLRRRHLDHRGDLRVREVPDLGEHERGALVVGQAGDVAEQVAQVGALLHAGAEPLGRGLELLHGHGRGLAGGEHREAAVAGDGEQPRAQVDLVVRRQQGPVGREHDVLERVLGVLERAEHVAAEAQQRPVVPVVDGLEGALVARRGELGEAAVVEPSGAEADERGSDCGRSHLVTHLATPGYRPGLATCQA
jgi:hypothetical protein